MNHKPINQFQRNIDSVKVLDAIYAYLNPKVTSFDLSEILRAEYVLIVSAFDCYVHDIVREGMIEIFEGAKSANDKFNDFAIPFKIVNQLLSTNDSNTRKQIIDIAIKEVTSKDTYQAPAKIENALGLIAVKNIWSLIVKELPEYSSAKEIRDTLNIIVNRRNKIAHEADIDRATGQKKAINTEDITDALKFIEKIVFVMDVIVKKI
ncbi:MAG: hypothetical protein HY842_01960 [Bacteroidetes bacterium]|nr:hypothetical protein [Bacteroidota bacterium]